MSYVASKSRLKLATSAVLSADAGLLVVFREWMYYSLHSCFCHNGLAINSGYKFYP